MGHYHVGQACLNGHGVNDRFDSHPQFNEKFCAKCGEPTITACPECNIALRGDYESNVVVLGGEGWKPDAFCYSCGKPFPWTLRRKDAAVELATIDGALSETEVKQLTESIEVLSKDSPQAQVGAARIKSLLKKMGSGTASAVRDIVVDVASEAAKKMLLGP